MNVFEKLHMLHRCWRYRLRSEKEAVQFLLKQDLAGTIAVDAGANRGIYTYWLSKQVGRSGHVYAFEPQPELIPALEGLRDSFHLDNVSVVNKGLSSSNGSTRLYRKEVGSGGASFEFGKESKLPITVDTVRLDDYLTENSVGSLPVSFIKADVEGHEFDVFTGAEGILRKHRPILLFECHHAKATQGEAFSFLTGLGYRGCFFYRGREIDYSAFSQFPYRKPGQSHRDYMFTYDGQ